MAERSRAGGEKRQPVNVKVQPALRAKIEAAAQASDRTLSSEIERRLEASFADQGADLLAQMDDGIAKFILARAEKTGNSVAREVEKHIELAYEYKQIVERFFGGDKTHSMLQSVAQNMMTIEKNLGVRWFEAEGEVAAKMDRLIKKSLGAQLELSRMFHIPFEDAQEYADDDAEIQRRVEEGMAQRDDPENLEKYTPTKSEGSS